jgi:hypothetical protein
MELYFQCRVRKSPPLDHILSQTNPILYMIKICFNVIVPSTPPSLSCPPPRRKLLELESCIQKQRYCLLKYVVHILTTELESVNAISDI